MVNKVIAFVLLNIYMCSSSIVYANQVSIVNAEIETKSGLWLVRVTLQHLDKGWEYYADAWRIVTSDGTVPGQRTLYHPHVNEQPFTRSLSGVKIPSEVKQIYIEALDNLHGWSKEKWHINLNIIKGQDY